MSTTVIKKEICSTSAYTTDEVWGVVNKNDELVAVALGQYKVKALYVGTFETLEDDSDDVDEQFANLVKETKDKLIPMVSNYTVTRTETKK